MGTVDVAAVVAVLNHISWAAIRAGPSKHMRRLMGRAKRPIQSPHILGRGPARPIKLSEDGPRPGPGHQNFIGWAAARPRPSHFQTFTARSGPARPGPAHQIFKSLGPARPGTSHFQMSRPGPARSVTFFRSAWPGPARPRITAHDKPC